MDELKLVNELEEENSGLKRILANQESEIGAVKYVLEKKYEGLGKSEVA